MPRRRLGLPHRSVAALGVCACLLFLLATLSGCSLFKKAPPPPPAVPAAEPAPPPPPPPPRPKPDAPVKPIAVPAAASATGTLVHAWITSGDRSRLLAPGADASFAALSLDEPAYAGSRFGATSFAPDPSGLPIIDIDPAQQFQAMLGFGVTLSDTSAWLLMHRLSAEQRQGLLQELYGPRSDLRLELVRVGIGAGEFSREHYSLNDLAPAGSQDDHAASRFSIEPQRDALLPVLKATQALAPQLRIFGVPWSAPAWMKSEPSLLQGTLRPDAYDAYARYLQRYLDVYRDEGLPVYALSVQNEPLRQQADYPAMPFEAAARARFVGAHLGPLLTRRNPDVRIVDGEQSWDAAEAVQQGLADPAAAAYVRGIAWHCYGGQVAAQTRVHGAAQAAEQDRALGEAPAAGPSPPAVRAAYLTECSGGDWAPDWREGLLHFARTALVGASRNWASGIMLGNLALDERGGPHIGGCRNCRGLVTIADGGDISRNVEYFALAHASRFVQPGARRIASGSRSAALEHVAFANPDGSLVLLIVNPAAQPRDFAVRMAGQGFRYRLPAASVATLLWQAKSPTAP
jgi:glucosylceramidase